MAQAREYLRRAGADLIILDVLLPDGDGLSFCAEIRRTHAMPILFLTGAVTDRDVMTGYRSGGNDKAAMQTREESALRDLRFIKQEALRLGRIVEQSEDGTVSALSAERMEAVDLNALLADAQAFCAPICEKRNNTLAVQCPEGLAVQGARDSLLQALYNLVINASRHTRNGRILLCARRKEQDVILSVRDSGEGMDEETVARAFDKGFTRDGGHGLGLALCREIAETHGGRIWIERNDPEKEITVSIALPDREGGFG